MAECWTTVFILNAVRAGLAVAVANWKEFNFEFDESLNLGVVPFALNDDKMRDFDLQALPKTNP